MALRINFNNSIDESAAYIQLKKLYPESKIEKTSQRYRRRVRGLPVNTAPLLFDNMTEEMEDECLLALALERLENDNGVRYSSEDIRRIFGITQEDIDNAEEEEFE